MAEIPGGDPSQPQIPHFMPGGQGFASKLEYEQEQAKSDLKMSKMIMEMDAELKDRFKALKTIQDYVHECDEEEQKEIRKLEIVFEEKYKEIYAMRERIINAKDLLPKDLIDMFDERAIKMKDSDYDKIEIEPIDCKAIQNTPVGVCDFWQKAILNHNIGASVSEKDRPILGYLTNIELNLHAEEVGEGYDLIFTFSPNSYFEGTEIKKQLFMKSKGVLDKTETKAIQWKAGGNPTVMKKKKKRGGKKVNVEVKTESFFNIFNNLDPDAEDEKEKPEKKDKGGEEDEDDEDDEINQKLQEDLDTADQFKDDLVPLALEYYLNVIETEDQDDDDQDDDDSDGEEQKPKKGKKGKKDEMPLGPDGKPQDCKQQ